MSKASKQQSHLAEGMWPDRTSSGFSFSIYKGAARKVGVVLDLEEPSVGDEGFRLLSLGPSSLGGFGGRSIYVFYRDSRYTEASSNSIL